MKKVIHIKKCKKCRKMGIFTKLSTLSTPKSGKTGDYSGIEKERTFCRVVIKMKKCRKKELSILTFEWSNIKNKFAENVYTMVKSYYNGNTEIKRRR